MVYGYHIIIITDYDNTYKLRVLNTAQTCLLTGNCDSNYMVIIAHDDGIYPVIEIKGKYRT